MGATKRKPPSAVEQIREPQSDVEQIRAAEQEIERERERLISSWGLSSQRDSHNKLTTAHLEQLDEFRKRHGIASPEKFPLTVQNIETPEEFLQWIGAEVTWYETTGKLSVGSDCNSLVRCASTIAARLRKADPQLGEPPMIPSLESTSVEAALLTFERWARTRAVKTTTKESPVHADGPMQGNRFWFCHKSHDLRPIPWKLLAAMWQHESRDMDDVLDEVWDTALAGDELKSALRDLKKQLQKIKYPRFVSKVRRDHSLVWKVF